MRFAQARGRAQKQFTVPLCRTHYRELYRAGAEKHWWSKPAQRKVRELAYLCAVMAGCPGKDFGHGSPAIDHRSWRALHPSRSSIRGSAEAA